MSENKEIITSTANPVVKKLRALDTKKYRDEDGLFVVEGWRHVQDGVEEGWELDTLSFSPRARTEAAQFIASCQSRKMEVSDEILASITGRDNTQSVIGVFKQRFLDLADIGAGLWLGLEEIRDPGNLGTIIRTADAVGVQGIILIGNTCDPFSPEAIRATTGSFARVPVIKTKTKDFIAWRKGYKGQVIGTHLQKKTIDYRKAPKNDSTVLLMGSESAGLSTDIANACDMLVKIPMGKKTESLNLAISAGIMLYTLSPLPPAGEG